MTCLWYKNYTQKCSSQDTICSTDYRLFHIEVAIKSIIGDHNSCSGNAGYVYQSPYIHRVIQYGYFNLSALESHYNSNYLKNTKVGLQQDEPVVRGQAVTVTSVDIVADLNSILFCL